MKEKLQITIVSHTHWDRAWYVTFQEFRARLVRLVDRLLKILLEMPDYHVYTLDGQMAILEDYLEVRPDRRVELEKLCKEGRLKVGPWYVLADEFLVSPESLIRNMQLGFRIGTSFGGVSKLGYVPDGFGHILQLPQILRGFGITNAFFWRGLGEEGEELGTEFVWEAPDGSAVTTIWMPDGYHNISNLGYAIHWGDTSQMEFDVDLAVRQIHKAVDSLTPRANTNAILLMNGIDHEEPEPRLPQIIYMARARFPDMEICQGTLIDHLENVKRSGIPLPVYRGEFRWGKYAEILQGVYATRIYLKQTNHRIENLFERYAEPLAALAWLSGAQIPDATQDLIWTGLQWLLKNHPHDDIYGSGIDQVHEEMMFRFSQAEQIGQIVLRDCLRQLAREVDFTQQMGMPVIAFNPLGWVRREMALGEVDFDFDDPMAGDFQVIDSIGQVIPHQVIHEQEIVWMETLKANRKRRLRVAIPVEVPACGYAGYFIKPEAKVSVQGPLHDWYFSDMGAENQFLSFAIHTDGSLTVRDKGSGVIYDGLHHFEDVEDAGDEYSYCPCADSQIFSTQHQLATIRKVLAGPNLVCFEVIKEWLIPKSLTEDRKQRSPDLIPMMIRSRISLYRNQPGVFIETEVTNLAQDHKLSVVFPTNLNPNQVYVDESFCVVPRQVDLPDSTGWVEDLTSLMHQRAFTDVSQDGRGLAILNRGLPAVEVTRGTKGVKISLILLRCVGWLSREDLSTRRVAAGPLVPTPGAQCPGTYTFEYAIFPHQGDWKDVFQVAYEYLSPVLLRRADTHEGLILKEMNITRDDPGLIREIPWPRGGKNPIKASFLEVDRKELVLSALYRSRGSSSVIARYYNISSELISAHFVTGKPLNEVWSINLDEDRQDKIALTDEYSFAVSVKKNQVITFELSFKQS